MKDFCIVRILGNDLPPRHGKHQTLKNLEFTLHHELDFPECNKHWLINRMIDNSEENAIKQLLDAHHQSYSVLPFELNDYDYGWSDLQKIRYLIQLNSARNTAIDLAKNKYKWVFPLDGGIFFSADGWANITDFLKGCNDELVKINMYRVRFNNQEALSFSIIPALAQEPQVALKSNSSLRFDESLCYGYQNKERLLQKYPNAPCLDYVIRLNDYSAGFITKKRWKDREQALKNLIDRIESGPNN